MHGLKSHPHVTACYIRDHFRLKQNKESDAITTPETMKRHPTTWTYSCLCALLIVPAGDCAGSGTPKPNKVPATGEPSSPRTNTAPGLALAGETFAGSYTLPLLDGGTITLPSPGGTNLWVLDVCATWCKWCRLATPVLAGIARDYAAQGVRLVEVSTWGEKPDNIRRYLTRARLDLTVAIDQGSQMANALHVTGVPTILIVDSNGVVKFVQEGYDKELGAAIRRELDLLLPQPPGPPSQKTSPGARADSPEQKVATRRIDETMVIGEWTIAVDPTADVLAKAGFRPRRVITIRAGAAQPEINTVAEPFDQEKYDATRETWLAALKKPEMQWRLILKPDHTGQHLVADAALGAPREEPVTWELRGTELRLLYPREKQFNTKDCTVVSPQELLYPMQPLGGWLVMRHK